MDDEDRPHKKQRVSEYFQLAPVEEDEARRLGLEKIIAKGLLWKVLDHLETGDVRAKTSLTQAVTSMLVADIQNHPHRCST